MGISEFELEDKISLKILKGITGKFRSPATMKAVKGFLTKSKKVAGKVGKVAKGKAPKKMAAPSQAPKGNKPTKGRGSFALGVGTGAVATGGAVYIGQKHGKKP